MRSFFSYTVTAWPARRNCCAAASPAGPLPTTATRRPVLCSGGSGWIHPSSHARSTMLRSISLMETAGSVIASTHAVSHGAGQMRPVNSGKLLVACSRRIALAQRPLYTRSFQSGIRLFSGQPVWQKGTPQSMQRAPCSRCFASPKGS